MNTFATGLEGAVYIHVPYCRQACSYCDFYFSTHLASRSRVVAALCKELELRAAWLPSRRVQSVYFGGGTPSLLPLPDLERLLGEVHRRFEVARGAEITLEANPDDLTTEATHAWRALGFNRLSLGVQSFNAEVLAWMNRAHSARQALEAIDRARAAGFAVLNLDLIYALPEPYTASFQADLSIVVAQKPEHISAYALTIEGRNRLAAEAAAGRIAEPPAEVFAAQFEYLNQTLTGAGYEHYEISNFAQPGQRAVHNTGYWRGVPYLGIGPSAHSFDGQATRFANVRNLHTYIDRIEACELAGEPEYLTRADLQNEFWLTRLRLAEPLTRAEVVQRWGPTAWQHCQPQFEEWQQQNLLIRISEQTVALTLQGRLQADRLAAELFVDSPSVPYSRS